MFLDESPIDRSFINLDKEYVFVPASRLLPRPFQDVLVFLKPKIHRCRRGSRLLRERALLVLSRFKGTKARARPTSPGTRTVPGFGRWARGIQS